MSTETMPPLIITPPGRYRHYKGMEYDVVGTVRVYVSGKVVAEVPVETTAAVAAVDSMWQKAWDSVRIMIMGG